MCPGHVGAFVSASAVTVTYPNPLLVLSVNAVVCWFFGSSACLFYKTELDTSPSQATFG